MKSLRDKKNLNLRSNLRNLVKEWPNIGLINFNVCRPEKNKTSNRKYLSIDCQSYRWVDLVPWDDGAKDVCVDTECKQVHVSWFPRLSNNTVHVSVHFWKFRFHINFGSTAVSIHKYFVGNQVLKTSNRKKQTISYQKL